MARERFQVKAVERKLIQMGTAESGGRGTLRSARMKHVLGGVRRSKAKPTKLNPYSSDTLPMVAHVREVAPQDKIEGIQKQTTILKNKNLAVKHNIESLDDRYHKLQ